MQEEPHRDLCAHIVHPGKKRKLTLMPRNSFKSSVVTCAGAMYFLLRNPNERILIASETQKNAVKYAKEIRTHYEQNKRFRALYGDWVSQENSWRDGDMIVAKRTAIKKESSITAGSLEKGVITGMHFDRIILDDVVSPNNTQTPEAIEKTLMFYKLLLSILDPEGYIYICGTRWHYLDLYGWLQSPENKESEKFDVFIRKADDGDGAAVGNPLMPKILSKEFLQGQMDTQGESIYSHQYRNAPMSGEEAVFRPEQVQFYDKTPAGLYHFMCVDPAISLEQGADSTGLTVVGTDFNHNWWVKEAIQEQIPPDKILDLIFTLAQKYSPIYALGLQKFHLEKFLKINLDAEMLARNFFIPIKDLKTDNRVSKEYRIRALQPRFQKRQVFIKKEHKALYDQICMYPQVAHDDVLDALQMQLQITFPSDVRTDPLPEDPLTKLPLAQQEVWEQVRKMGGGRRVKEGRWKEL